ncbi:protein-cysteine S-palmitoyltransferase [Aureococcus anophagefferens]|uniref:Palmitoyltransferase n=1 Tax=Aureococcus anophagefferens TaxID=44056 RepID=A0ABR1GBY7_AURAN
MFTNPGAVPRHAQPLIRASESGIPETICGRCDAYKPPRSHHCRICNRCIVRMDHHCPWMNNCIGANNQKHFMLFLLYTIVEAVYALALIATNYSNGTTYPSAACSGLVAALLAVSIATLMFVATMMYNQIYAIVTGIGTIDRMRKRGPKGNFAPVPWVDVFGVDPWPMYLLPTDVKYRDFHRVMGYKVATWEISPGPIARARATWRTRRRPSLRAAAGGAGGAAEPGRRGPDAAGDARAAVAVERSAAPRPRPPGRRREDQQRPRTPRTPPPSSDRIRAPLSTPRGVPRARAGFFNRTAL